MRKLDFIFRIAGLLVVIFFSLPARAQLNMVLQDSMDYPVGVNDVVGWADPQGREYALVGLNTGVSIVNIDSDTLKEVAFVSGVNNLWRDINTFGHYAYVSSEARVGLLIIDLQYLPDSVQTFIWQDSLPTANGPRPFEKAHTLWIDEHGICYLNGSNLNNGGVVMIDVKSNPTDPVFLGYAPPIYSHDVYARDSMLYSAEIYAGDLSIYDLRDPANVSLIGRVKTPNEFTHNAWLSDDSRYLYTTDERANSYVAAYDIQDPANIIEVDRYRQPSTDGTGAIPHNVFVWNDWLIVAYYTSGTTVVDAARPDNLIEVGEFDSWLGQNGGFDGVWGAWPFLPSGKILASDRRSGLFVFIPNYVRACYLEGIVVDSLTQQPLLNANVQVISPDDVVLPELSKIDGTFKTGKAIPGKYDVRITREGYYPKTLALTFVNGEVLAPRIELVAVPKVNFTGRVIDMDGQPVPLAQVIVTGNNGTYSGQADDQGEFQFLQAYIGSYQVQAGIWGMMTETTIELEADQDLVIQVRPGYWDDFDLDLGWTVSGTVTSGAWARGLPSPQILYSQWDCGDQHDSPFDVGSVVYSTGLSTAENVLNDEVNNGTTFLTSPHMDFSTYVNPRIEFDYWLCEFPPNQYVGLRTWITNGADTLLLGELRNDTIAGSWQRVVYDNLPFIGQPGQVHFIISATDTTTTAFQYVLKAHFDNFRVIDETLASEEPLRAGDVLLYPNPSDGATLYLRPADHLRDQPLTIWIYDARGVEVFVTTIAPSDKDVVLRPALPQGYYQVRWLADNGETGVAAWIVQRR